MSQNVTEKPKSTAKERVELELKQIQTWHSNLIKFFGSRAFGLLNEKEQFDLIDQERVQAEYIKILRHRLINWREI